MASQFVVQIEDVALCTCRICYEEEELASRRLVAPCRCSGSVKYIHADCLAQEVNFSGNLRCSMCRHDLRRTVTSVKPIWEWRMPSLSAGWLPGGRFWDVYVVICALFYHIVGPYLALLPYLPSEYRHASPSMPEILHQTRMCIRLFALSYNVLLPFAMCS